MERNQQTVVVIVGPTGSGKTALSLKLAEKYNGEIICADSRTVYRYLDIGTAKPTLEERRRVRHHLIDIVEPNETFTAADFQKYANIALDDIQARAKLPFVVGGTGLYVDSLLFNYNFGPPGDVQIRKILDEKTTDELVAYCISRNIELPQNTLNRRYLIRAIEQGGVNKKRNQKIDDSFIVVGIATEKEVLRDRLSKRIDDFMTSNVIDEVRSVTNLYRGEYESLKSNIYPIIKKVIEGTLSIEEAKSKALVHDWRLAKRQLTWFKRNQSIKWLPLSEAEAFLDNFLNDKRR